MSIPIKPVDAWACVITDDTIPSWVGGYLEVFKSEEHAATRAELCWCRCAPVTIAPREEWIAVTPETMPPIGSSIWVWLPAAGPLLGFFNGDEFLDLCANEIIPVGWVSHYMPARIPSPPKVTL